MAGIDASKYLHSPAHKAVLTRDYAALKRILASLPRLADPSDITAEAAAVAEEEKADAVSAVVDSRNVPNRETPLHLAVKIGDPTSAEMLMAAGADWSLQNEQGWSALQEAICLREENIAKIIVRYYQPSAWAKWCRRLPRVVATMRRMRDFYMEITFNFESSVIPFISRIAPSDTYKIWKRGPNLRADMTLAGFDGFRIQRADQSVLFLGEGSEDHKIPPGSLCMISHKDKEIMNALDGAGTRPSEEEIDREVAAMFKTNIFRPGIDVTQAVLLPQMTWRRQEKSEMVGVWKAKVYDMHHVTISVKSRRVPGAMTDDEFFDLCNDNDTESEGYEDILTEDEKKQLEAALNIASSSESIQDSRNEFAGPRHSCYEPRDIVIDDVGVCNNNDAKLNKKGGWFSWGKRGNNHKQQQQQQQQEEVQKKNIAAAPSRGSIRGDDKASNLLDEPDSRIQNRPARHSVEGVIRTTDERRGKMPAAGKETGHRHKEGGRESEYKKGLRPVLWLSPSFPLRTEELLPLLDIIANKVKAVRRLRELLTTKLPAGTFPVKVAIPVVPTIRVLVTFTKFEELQPVDEFATPPSSPENSSSSSQPSSSSWLQWMKASYRPNHTAMAESSNRVEDVQDPFSIPPDYVWVTPEEKRKKMQENKSKKKKPQTQ